MAPEHSYIYDNPDDVGWVEAYDRAHRLSIIKVIVLLLTFPFRLIISIVKLLR